MWPTLKEIDAVTEKIIGCAIEVHKTIGAGLLESTYRECLSIEMRSAKLNFDCQRTIKLSYKGEPINTKLQVDLLVENLVVVELKAVETLHPVHQSQVITYLKASGCPSGLLLNFNVTAMTAGIKRLEHPELYPLKKKIFPS